MKNPEPVGDRDPDRADVSIRLVRLSLTAMEALAAGDHNAAAAESGVAVTDYLAGEQCAWLWRLRIKQITEDPSSARWVARAAVSQPDGSVVGVAGFHGPPDANGMVEVGYRVDPAHRRRGYARAILTELLRWAATETEVRTVRASISPDNVASLATIAGFGFSRVGELWDDVDGLETLFEVPVPANLST